MFFSEAFFIPRGLITIVLFYKIPEQFKLSTFNINILFFSHTYKQYHHDHRYDFLQEESEPTDRRNYIFRKKNKLTLLV